MRAGEKPLLGLLRNKVVKNVKVYESEEINKMLIDPNTQSCTGYLFSPPLYILNYRAGIWHLTLALVMLGLNFALNPMYMLELNRSWANTNASKLPEFLKNGTCCKNTTGPFSDCRLYNDVFDWFTCIQPELEDWRDGRVENENDLPLYEPTLTQITDPIPLINLIILFEFITAGSHFWIYARDGGRFCGGGRGRRRDYSKRLRQQLNPHRWMEYAITASLMLMASLALSRVSDAFLLASLFINSFFLNFVGGNCFELLYLGERNSDPSDKELYRTIKWIAFGASWFCFLINIITTWDAYFTIIEPYIELNETGHLWSQLFSVITWANATITLSFSVFPIIHLYQFTWPHKTRKKEVRAYINGETAYIWASFVSKTALTVIIGSAALMRKDS
jgi:hypothetical protein